MEEMLSKKFNRTDKQIINAFMRLLAERSIDKINVIDICEEAMIKRATFYNHFESKEQVFYAIIDEIENDLFLSIVENEENYTLQEMLEMIAVRTVDFLIDNKERITVAINNIRNRTYETIIVESINRSIRYLINKNKDRININFPIEMASRFFSGGFTALAVWWLTTDNNCTKEDLLTMVNSLLKKILA